jgi:uncharacterized glyoxalase superfamily protein PhnB
MTVDAPQPTTVRELAPLLYVDDIERSLGFYVQHLDFRQTQAYDNHGRLSWCRLERGGAALMLQQICDEDHFATPRGDGIAFYFLCDDADDVYRRLRNRGIAANPPEVAFYGMKQVLVIDPDGYRLCFQNPVAATGGRQS